MEPARSDEIAGPPGYPRASRGPDGQWFTDPQPTAVHRVPRPWPWPAQPESAQFPALGPTQALRGRAGGPGLTAPPGAVPGLLDPERRSGWQLAQQVWQESGVRWEPADPAPDGPASLAGPGRRPSVRPGRADTAAEFTGDGAAQSLAPGRLAEDWAGPVAERGRPVAERGRPVAERGRPVGDGPEPAPVPSGPIDGELRPGTADVGGGEFAAEEFAPEEFAADESVVSESADHESGADDDATEAVGEQDEGWAEPAGPDPAWEEPAPRNSDGQDPAPQDSDWQDSGWQEPARQDPAWRDSVPRTSAWRDSGPRDSVLRDRAWQDSARQDPAWQDSARQDPAWQDPAPGDSDWQDPAPRTSARRGSDPRDPARRDPGATGPARRLAPGWNEYPHAGYPGQSWPIGGTGQVPLPPQAFAAMPLGAPVATDERSPWSAGSAGSARSTRPAATGPQGEPDALFRAWQGSVRQAAGPRRHWPAARPGPSIRHRHGAWRAVTIGVPAAVIVTVGAGALLMLTGKANEMLAVRGDTGTLPAGAAASAGGGGATDGTRVTGVTLTGYPGQHGSVAADSIWSAADASLAVGSADGHPAIWRRAGGSWTLVSAAVLDAVSGTGNLTAIAHGPAGWIAVGLTAKGGSTFPLVLASADGVTWQPVAALMDAAGADTDFIGVTAGSGGYAVVGRQMIGGRAFAVLWWSADLRMWVQGANGGLDGRLTASTANAAATSATGFVAVGSHGALAAIWTSPDGAHWNLSNVPTPSDARSATLRQVVTSGNTIVATGFAVTAAGDIPLAVVSADGGAHWQPVILPVPGGLAAVTALTVEGGTLVAAGLTGSGLAGGGQASGSGAQHVITWTSADGLHWSAATAVAGVRRLSALSESGGALTGTGTATGSAQHGTDPAIVTFPAP